MGCYNQQTENDQKVVCKKAYHKKYYAKNRERILAQQKRYRAENVEILKTRRKRWYENNKKTTCQQPESLLSTEQGAHRKLPQTTL